MTKKYNLYLGKGGHLVIMAEFLVRGWNVAIPEVDIGDDIFVVEDHNGTVKRIQVKTSSVTQRKNTFSAQYQIPYKQLNRISTSLIYYVFIARKKDDWAKPIIISQEQLLDYVQNKNVGSQLNGNVTLYFSYSENKVDCSGQDFTKFIADFTDFPIIEH